MELFTQCEPGKPSLEMVPEAGFELSPISKLKPQQKEANSGNLASIAEGFFCDGNIFLLRPGPTPGGVFLCWPDLISALHALNQFWGWKSQVHPLDVLRFEEALSFHDRTLKQFRDCLPFTPDQFESVLLPMRQAPHDLQVLVLERKIDMRLLAWIKSHGFVYTPTLGRILSAHEFSFSAQMKITEHLGKVMRRLSGGESEFLEKFGSGLQEALKSRHEVSSFLFDLACPVLCEHRGLRKKICQQLGGLVPGRFDFDESLEEDGLEYSVRFSEVKDIQKISDALKNPRVKELFDAMEKGSVNGNH